MKPFTTLALAAVLAVSGASATLASSIDALSAASSVSITTVSGNSDNILLASNGRVMQQVDLGTLRARVAMNKPVAAQLAAFGADLDDVIGVTGDDSTSVTLYVRN